MVGCAGRAGHQGRRTVAASLVLALALVVGCASFEGARLYYSGTQALDAGDVERAIDDLERAAELTPESSEVQNHLGLAYSEAGRRDEMLAAFRRAVDLDCENAAAVRNLEIAEAQAPPGAAGWVDGASETDEGNAHGR